MNLAPIILFVYNRPKHALKALEALSKDPLAEKSKLYIFADGPKQNATEDDLVKILQTREIIKQQNWCKDVSIIEQESNKGLAESILTGVTNIISRHEKAIVLEDDIIISPFFLNYMNKALSIYKDDEKVMHISSFVPLRNGNEKLPDTFFLEYMNCWGWATWKRAWVHYNIDSKMLYEQLSKRKRIKKFNLNNSVDMHDFLNKNVQQKLKTWATNWYASIFLNNGLCLYPKQSLSAQIGLDGSGVHCGSDTLNLHYVNLAENIKIERIKIIEDEYAFNYFRGFYLYGNFNGVDAIRHRLRVIKAKILNSF